MGSTIRQHSGAALVAAATITAGLVQGLFEPGAYAAGSAVVWGLLVSGLIGRVLPVNPIGRLVIAGGICLLATAILATASMAWAPDQGRAFEEAVRVWFYLGLFLFAAATASWTARSEWVAGLTVGLTVLAAIAVFSYLHPGILDSGRSQVPNASNRLSYPVGYWNGIAAMFAATTALLAYAGCLAPTRLVRSAAVAAIPFVGLGIWLASSRGGVAAAVLGWVVLVAAARNRGRQLVRVAIGAAGAVVVILVAGQMHALTSGMVDSARRADGDRMSVVLIAVIVLTGAAAWAADGRSPRLRLERRPAIALAVIAVVGVVVGLVAADPAARFRDFKAPPPADAPAPIGASGLNSNGRWQFWEGAIDAFGDHPIRGLGAGGYENWWARHASIPRFVRNPHSLPLQQASELGIPGFALFCGFVVVIGIAAVRRWRTRSGDGGVLLAVLVALAVGAAVDWTWEIPVVFGPAMIAAGLLASASPPKLLTGGGRRLVLATIAIGWVAIAASALVALAELELARSRDAASSGRLASAVDEARTARTIEPWSADPFAELAILESDRGRFAAALGYLKQAEERDSGDWRLAIIEYEIQLKAGDRAAARRALLRAQALSPFFHSGTAVELG